MKDLLNFFDKPRDPLALESIRVSIASPEMIRRWSYGEVKKPETINYRTFKPEREGLFCCKIFGPIKDYECLCGKYKGMKYRTVVCEKCGTEVTRSKVRRERMGHIELTSPVAHIWFLGTASSRIGNFLGLSVKDVQRILYCEYYVVVDPMDTDLKKGQLLSEEEYEKAQQEYGGPNFKVDIGGSAIKSLIKSIDVDFTAKQLRKSLEDISSEATIKKIRKRIKVMEDFQNSINKPEWMMLESLPVIPPDLRPLVPLEGGRFATSDLNDLYRRVINRNNRLRKLQELNAPEIIIRNEKRMLQEAVDALLDNGRSGKVFTGSNKRPLRSLSEILKGKQGRFRSNLLGKRVDYSGRSVIVVGPHLRLHECGLPKTMALELFKPFIYNKLEKRGMALTVKQAKALVEEKTDEVWDILSEVVKEHPVLLNRAPTLHRLGIQAFEPILHEGRAIQLHPLVCTAFNADFDGDQMAVHVPLSIEAQTEARVLMMSTNNILSPASGQPIINPTQDMVLGVYWMTRIRPGARNSGKIFSDVNEVIYAYETDQIDLQASIKCRVHGKLEDTSVGRVLLSAIVPKEVPFKFYNRVMNKGSLADLINKTFRMCGGKQTVILADKLMNSGFKYSTKAGISISINDLQISSGKKELLQTARTQVDEIRRQYDEGLITEGERYNKVIDTWTDCGDKIATEMMDHLEKEEFDVDGKQITSTSFNPIFIMADSGARSSTAQIRQLSGMRGLMAKPSGEIIETPITANFREGLTVSQYFISTHGARKGLADTALKTANSGYLTRKLVDVSQNVIVTEKDCGSHDFIEVTALVESGGVIEPLSERILGRTAFEDIINPNSSEVICLADEEINESVVEKINQAGIEKVKIRSTLTCQTKDGVCIKCYGRDLGLGRTVTIGETVGIIAAQSIGEPGTQLTMRTFHLGGTASRSVEQSEHIARYEGTLKFENINTVQNREGKWTVMNRGGEISILDETGWEREKISLIYGAVLNFKEGDKVKKGDTVSTWDPYTNIIVSDVSGVVKFQGIESGINVVEQVDPATGFTTQVITESKSSDHQKCIVAIVDEKGEPVNLPGRDTPATYILSTGSQLMISNGDKIHAGDIISKIHKESTKTKDITGGLPRVAELFEARHPKEPSILSEIEGYVNFGKDVKGKQKVIVTSREGEQKEYLLPKGKFISVREGELIKKGDSLMDGTTDPHDILNVSGVKAVASYLVNEVQQVYRLQGVAINDKHIELIIRQMLRKCEIADPGDTNYITGEQVEISEVQSANEKVIQEGGRPANYKHLLLGITKTSLNTKSWLSAASFQETTRILTEAAVQSKVDKLVGLKENVIMGRLIPAGTVFSAYHKHPLVVETEEEESVNLFPPPGARSVEDNVDKPSRF
ncbi:MAG: DNA-directed RNA polymerase subunit beta' [Bdellovibrionaceae bacterium]|nr:DNA-directed RNA polymerase subunit beta' [Pseudobdellovibrionaceae bacterium]